MMTHDSCLPWRTRQGKTVQMHTRKYSVLICSIICETGSKQVAIICQFEQLFEFCRGDYGGRWAKFQHCGWVWHPDLPNTKHLLRSIRSATYSYCDHIGKTRLYCCWPLASVHKSSSAPKIPGNQLLNPYFTKTLNPQHNFGRGRREVQANEHISSSNKNIRQLYPNFKFALWSTLLFQNIHTF